MTRTAIRRVAWIAVGVLLLAAGVYVARVASILAAYKAKMLCSEVLLAHRDSRGVLAELEVDDLTPLRYVSASVDSSARIARQLLPVSFGIKRSIETSADVCCSSGHRRQAWHRPVATGPSPLTHCSVN